MSNAAMTIKVETSDLVSALMRLAAAVNPAPNILTPDTFRPRRPARRSTGNRGRLEAPVRYVQEGQAL